jgi:hypothetical protein
MRLPFSSPSGRLSLHPHWDGCQVEGKPVRKERMTIYITERQKRQLEKRSQEENLPGAEIIRRALDTYLARDDPTYHRGAPASEKERRIHPWHE